MLRSCGRGKTSIRNRAIVVVGWRTGLRASEVINLRPKDIDLTAGTIRVLHGKGQKHRTVGIDPEAAAVGSLWSQARTDLGVSKRSTFFCTLSGRPLQTSYLRAMIPRIARRAGIEKRVHMHGLRHTFSVELARENTPIHVIMAALGHSNVSTTSNYIAHLEDPELVSEMRTRPPWSSEDQPEPRPRIRRKPRPRYD